MIMLARLPGWELWVEPAAESGHCGRMRLDEVIQPLETAVPLAMQSP
jgi:hypothetical protein